ncbi:hypothetical protein DLM45_11930 [Hyphomicrobium methylovorum]|uniref:hypothetical protein n=1 Tax=Hyphomicrobium methylovorum TaxID=84 RepID=UPI0015E6755F|nr:hypothetical protein [Hyphomicrobium methylovorum]MBA2126922.1 hypothetical protein [Hyphomicrobium methylovorum]
MELPGNRVKDAFDCVMAWRTDRLTPRRCPVCGADGLEISDHSARPYVEWYILACGACGLEARLSLPLAGPDH